MLPLANVSSLVPSKRELHEQAARVHKSTSAVSRLRFYLYPGQRSNLPALEKINSRVELESAIRTLDTALFAAYNQCDLEKFASFIAEDVEFYHDQGGVTLGREALTDAIKKNICGKVTRELVPGSLQVYPMKGFGAVEIGVHRFHHPGNDSEGIGEAQFIHLWRYKDGAWKITRVISYDHHEATK